jgi:hypothetical protein
MSAKASSGRLPLSGLFFTLGTVVLLAATTQAGKARCRLPSPLDLSQQTLPQFCPGSRPIPKRSS